MKKLVIVLLVFIIVENIILLSFGYRCRDLAGYSNADTTINWFRIDSIEYAIKVKDSIVLNIKEHERQVNEEVGALSDSASWILFRELVSEP